MNKIIEVINNAWVITIIGGIIVIFLMFIAKRIYTSLSNCLHNRKILNWLKDNTQDCAGKQFRNTEEITIGTGIRQEKVKTLCELHKKIYQCQNKEGFWGLYGDREKSIYEERGLISF